MDILINIVMGILILSEFWGFMFLADYIEFRNLAKKHGEKEARKIMKRFR